MFVDSGERPIATSINQVAYHNPSAFFAFLPSTVPLHAGDALNFQIRDTGEPHAIAMGRLVDKAVAAITALGTTAPLAKIEAQPAMRKVPSVFPDAGVKDVPVVNRSATEPCFLDSAAPPISRRGGAKACPDTKQPAFDGTQSFFSSGVIKEGEPFRVKLTSDIKPGTYHFMCLVHRSAMTGQVNVVANDQERPTVAELRKEADDEEEEVATSLQPPMKDAILRKTGPILAGAGPEGLARGMVTAFIPKDSKAKVGAPVLWKFYGTHSISFLPNRHAKEGVLITKDRELVANPDAWKPIGSRPLPAQVLAYPPSTKRLLIDGGTWDGKDAFSSGVIRGTPPAAVTYGVRFSKPGTYAYSCVVHSSMRGTIVVS